MKNHKKMIIRYNKRGIEEMIKNIIFDLMKVIIKKESNVKTLMNFTNDSNKAEELQKYIFETEEWKLLDLGNITQEQAIREMQRKAPKEYTNLIEEIMNKRCQYFTVNEETVKIAKRLKEKGYHIYVLSNMSEFAYTYFKDIDFFQLCDGIMISAYEHLVKPEEKIFKTLLDRYHLNPQECLFIDDDDTGKSLETANRLGILGRRVKPNDSQDVLTLLEEYKIEV